MNNIYYQDDNERYYYCMDFSTHDLVSLGDTITGTPVVTSEVRGGFASDLVIEDVAASGLYACMWISGGTQLRTYKIEVKVNVSSGRILEGDGFVKIGD